MACLVLSEARSSKNDLKRNFIRHKEKQGFVIERIPRDEDRLAEGRDILATGKRLNERAYIAAILAAATLNPGEYNDVLESLGSGEWVSEADRLAFERTSLEEFYREPVSEDLIRLDDRGQFRAKVSLFELVFLNPDLLRLRAFEHCGLVATGSSKAIVLAKLLQLTPLVNEGRLRSEAIIHLADLGNFSETLIRHKTVIETHLGLEIRKDVKEKPVQQLGRYLRLVGLKLARLPAFKENGRKVYPYRLEQESLARMKAIVEARRPQGERHFSPGVFGIPGASSK
jgi:hypothetical protein